MKIAFNPSTVAALITPPNNKDITFDLRGRNIFARGVKFCGTDTWRDIKINNVSIDSNILDLRNGSNTTLTNTNGVVTINSTWRPVVDNLTSDSTTSSLSAKQGKVLKSLIDGKSNSGHTHDDRYLKLTGGTMASNALITFADSGSWGTDKGPQGARGGLYWTGQSDYAKLYAEETAEDNLDLVIQFGDDNSNGLSIRNKANTQTSYISAGGVITTGTFKGNLDWSYITNKPTTATRWPSWAEVTGKPSSFTPSTHTHGLSNSVFFLNMPSISGNAKWKEVFGYPVNYNLLLSVRINNPAPEWCVGNFGSGILYGGSDTKGFMSSAYNEPLIMWAGGNGSSDDSVPKWYIGIKGIHKSIYNLATIASEANSAYNLRHSHSNKSVLDGITSGLVNNWNTAYTFVNTITGTDTDKVINKWDEIVNFLAGITEDNKLNTLLNSKLSVYKLADNTNVGAIKNNGIYYSTSDASSGTLVNSPFNNGFTLINMTSLDNGDDLRRSRLAFNAYGEIKVSDDRDLANTAETWYNVLTSKNSGINGSTIKLNGTSITVYSSGTADGRYVKKSGDTMSGVLTINTTNFGALTIKRNDDANGASIQFRGKSSVYGYIGLNNSTKDKLFLRWNSDTSKTYTILDTSSTYTSNGRGVINGTTITQVDNATNSTNSTNARKLVNWYSARQTSLNTQFGDGSLRIFYATSSTTEGKPAEDSHILHLAWDNNGGWDAQLAVHTRSGKVSTRAQNSGTWQPWKTLAFTTDIPSSLKNPYSLTTFGVVYDGSAAKTVTTSTFISLVTEGTSTITDGTMFITSYASNSGFTDTNAVNVPYKRKAIHLWEYIKAKTDSLYATKGHNHDNRYLKLTGGIMTGTIYRNSGGSTISGRDHAIIRLTHAPGGSSWNPIACVDTETGTWTLGHLSSGSSDTNFHFCFSTNADYNAGNNNGNYVTLRNKVGTIALLSDIPSSLKNPHALTISLNGTSQGPYDGSAAKNINITPSSIGAATSGHNHDGRYVYNYGGTSANGLTLNQNALFMSTTSGITGDWWHILQAAWNNEYRWNSLIAFPTLNRNGMYYRSGLDDNTKWGSWVKLLDVNNYSSTLDSRYYTESEVNNLLNTKLNRQNLSYGVWNPRGYNLAADYLYNGGDLSISENSGKMYVSIDGLFYQNEGLYRVLDTSDIGSIHGSLTLYQYLSSTDTNWFPLVWGGSDHKNTSNSTGSLYKSYDKLSWLTSSLTLHATNIQTNNIKNLSIGGGIYWNPYVESTTDGSDAASITLVRLGVAGGTTLVLSLMNDANDTILFKTNGSARLYHNSYPILTTLNTYVSNNKGYINGTEITLVNNSDKVDNRHAISTTPNTGIIYKAAIYTSSSLTSYWVRLASIPSISLNGEFIATIHVLSGHSNPGRSAILLVYLRGSASSFMSKSFKICSNSNYDPNRFRLYYKDSDKTSEIWYQTTGLWDGIITTVISLSSEGSLYEGLTLYSGSITVVQTPSMSTYLSALVSTITDNISGNASTATKLQTSRNLWGNSFNGTTNISGTIIFNNVTSGLCEGILWTCGDSDFARIKAGATGSDAGYLEIATADGGSEPIYVRQYTGVFSSVKRTLTLLDANGYTHFPSYINIGGNENNNSSPDRVWGSNGSDSYLRSYRTSALRVAYANNASNATNSINSNRLSSNAEFALGNNFLLYFNTAGLGSSGVNNAAPDKDWWHIIRMNHPNSKGYFSELAIALNSYNGVYWRTINSGREAKPWTRLANIEDLAWNNIVGKPSSYTPSAHTHSWTSITGKLVAGNEFNIVNAGFNEGMWFNYVPINDRSKTATITGYHFGNGATGYTSINASGFIKKGSNSNYVLLGDGGHKLESSLNVANADKVDGYHASGLWRSDGATWNPNANVSLTANGNNQEWSFDIRRNGYTGCYWHVWDSARNTMLKVNADNGKVYAPYNFVGNLEGNASTATKLTSSAGNVTLPIYFSDGKPIACTASSIFSNLSNSGNNISVTVAGQNRTLTVGYATNTDMVDGEHASAFTRIVGRHGIYTSGTAPYNYIHLFRIANSSGYSTVDCEIDFRTRYHSAKLEIRISTAQYPYNNGGSSISIVKKVVSGRTCKFWVLPTIQTSNYNYYDVYYESGAWNSGSYGIIFKGSNGSVVFEHKGTNLASLPDKVVPVTDDVAASATKVIVNLHTANDTNYPLVWSNLNNTNTVTENQLYKSWSDLYYNPKNKRLTVGGSVVASSFVKSGGTSLQLLRADGGIAAFNWSGQSGLPTWLWGGNNLHSYYVYNPSNFRVAYASSAGNADTVDGIDSTGFLRYYNSNSAPSNVDIVNTPSYVWTVSTTGGSVANTTKPSGIDNAWGVIHLHTHIGNYATQLGFGGTTGRMYMRNAYNTSTFGNWQALAFTTDNVASATKLQTARSIWGHSFNGTADVNGTIYINNSNSSEGAIRLNNNINSNARISAIDSQVIFNTDAAIRFGGTSWDWNVWAGLKYTHSNKTIYLGIADGSVFNANSALSGGSLRFPGISNVYATTFNGSLSGNASTATNADKLDGTHLNGIFTAFGNNAHNITATIGGVTKSFLVNWAADSDKLDGYHENSFLRYRGDTSTDLEATLWSLIGIKLYNNALPDNLTGVYNYGSVISLPGSSSRFEIYASHLSSNGNGLYYRSGWSSDKKSWLKFIDSSNIGSQSVNYANSAGNADKLDGIHANGLLTALSNSNNGISITVGGTTKSVSNISVNYASSAGSATKVIVNLHTTNDTNYPLVWSNLSNSSTITENQLYKSWSDLYYNPKNKRLTVGGSVVASSFVKRGGTSLQLLRADGGIAAFNWSGQSGLPTWLWGGNNEHSYYVYNPSNFRVAYATSAGSADTALYLRSLGNLNCQTGRTLNYGDVYTYNTYANNTGAPTSYTSVIGFGRGIAGTVEIAGGWDNTNLYWRSLRDCCEDWHSWRTVLDSSNYTEFINNYYWANVKISTSSSTTTSPTVSNLTATSSIRMGNIYLLNTNEINSTSGIHLNYQNSGNISLCAGGGNVGIGTISPSYKLDVNGLMRASGFHHSSMNSDNYMLLAGGGYKSFGGDSSHPVFLGYLNLDHGSDGTVSSSFYCLGYSVPFTYTRGGNYCKISIPDTTHQAFYIKAATASVNYSGGGMDTWTGNHRGAGAWWLHCYAPSSNEVRVKGFHLKDTNNDSWWGGNPLWSDRSGVNRITVCIFGYVTFR